MRQLDTVILMCTSEWDVLLTYEYEDDILLAGGTLHIFFAPIRGFEPSREKHKRDISEVLPLGHNSSWSTAK
jgi:hypothetical protein